MITYLKDRKYYEDLYDKGTIKIGRREAGSFVKARELFYEKAKIEDKAEIKKMEFWFDRLYWWLVELPFLLPRWEEKETTITSWMSRDQVLDERLTAARPHIEHACSHCGKQGLKLKTKDLLHRDSQDHQSVLFMFDCLTCKKRSAFWEDGTEWVSPVTPCPKCNAALEMDVKSRGRLLTTTYTCNECGYGEVEKMRLGQEEKPEWDFEANRKIFCYTEEHGRKMQAYRPKWEEAMRMMDQHIERAANKMMYDAIDSIERLKIPQLIERLRPAMEKAGYIEVTFDKPQLGGYVTIEFSCMDGDSAREDAKSRKALKKAVVTALTGTNWRLMSDGIAYRLGYLNGRVRAYEDEQDLLKLVSE